MGGLVRGGGHSGHIKSEVRLIHFDTSSKMPPRQIPTGQVRLTFAVAPGSAAADAAGATVDEDDQDDETVLVAEQQRVSSMAKIMTRTWTSVMMICRPAHLTLFLSISLLLSL